MKPADIRALKVGDWITFTPTIWAYPIDGRIVDEDADGFLIEWDDGHTAIISILNLGSAKFQPLIVNGVTQ